MEEDKVHTCKRKINKIKKYNVQLASTRKRPKNLYKIIKSYSHIQLVPIIFLKYGRRHGIHANMRAREKNKIK